MRPEEIPAPIANAFADRPTMRAPELCRLLQMDGKTLRRHVKAGNIRYVLKGLGAVRPRREFMMSDVLEFLQNQGRRECPSTDPKTRNISSSTSKEGVYDFMALRDKLMNVRPVK